MSKHSITWVSWRWRKASRTRPSAGAHNSLGNLFKEQGRHEEALTCFRQALRLRPDFVDAFNNLGVALKDQGQISEALNCYRRALHSQPDPKHHSNLIYTLCYSLEPDALAIAEEAARWNEQHAAPHTKSVPVHGNDRSPDRRLRVGYVSPDFRDHVVGRNVWPLFREHDHSQFEIFCYSHLRKPDNLTRSFQGCADAWRDVADLKDEQLAQHVRNDRVDILIDLAVHTADNRLLVFAQKPSPIQVSFAGYPGTTGLTTIDYRLTDPYLDPPGQHDDWYSEQSLRLPDSFWCYDPLGNELPVKALPALTQGHLTFGCLNNFCKVNVPVLKLWAQVMQGIERSHLLLLAPEGSHRKQTIEFLAQHGISAERVTFIGFQPRLCYLELYHRIDLGLDTFPYNGHTTSLDALWMGVPVVTLVGATVVGRAGLSQLTNVGLPELVAATPEQFVRVVVELAQDVPRLSRLRAALRERMQASPLMDARRFTRGIEAAYRMMWRRWCEQSS
jgi:protein O-GlcNAc transferase